MRVKRTLPPAAAPIRLYDIFCGIQGMSQGQAAVDKFKANIKSTFEVRHCFLVSSGKAALTLILQALHRLCPERNEVLIPAFTCYSVPSAIVRAGLKVRLADIEPQTLDFDFSDLSGCLKPKEKLLALVSPHLFGMPANIAAAKELLNDPEIPVIEDAAQAMGGVFGGKQLGTLGDAGFFSLGRGKAFSTVEGGVIITNSDQLAGAIHTVMQEIMGGAYTSQVKLVAYAVALSALTKPSLFWLPKSMPGLRLGETIFDPGFPIKPYSSFQAGLAKNWHKRLMSFKSIRKKNVLYWTKTLADFPWLKPVCGANDFLKNPLPLLRFPAMVVNTDFRNTLLDVSERCGFGIMPSYPAPVNDIKGLRVANDRYFSGAKQCADHMVTFPAHEFVSPARCRQIVSAMEMMQV